MKLSPQYKVRVHCRNCGGENTVTLPCGQAIKESECPTCGCESIERASFSTGYRFDPPSSPDPKEAAAEFLARRAGEASA